MTDLAPSGAFETIPNLRILVDGKHRGTIDTRDWERWEPETPLTNWWWITCLLDDGSWVEDSCSIELKGATLEELEERTRRAVEALIALKHPEVKFEALKTPIADDIPDDAGEGSTSMLFGTVDRLVCAALEGVMG
ncbi:MAG: hypothetical protein ABI743_10250 [bacterium]